ncbi:MAG: DUF5818 domain-containing protein [Pseudomonadota bacterium]
MTSARGLLVEVDDGGIYALDTDPDAKDLVGHRVTIEGVRSGFDRIAVEWIGQADTPGGFTEPNV